MPNTDELLDVPGLSEYLKIPEATLYKWRATRPPKGPPGVRIGRYVRYRRSDVDRWLESLAELPEDPPPSRRRSRKAV